MACGMFFGDRLSRHIPKLWISGQKLWKNGDWLCITLIPESYPWQYNREHPHIYESLQKCEKRADACDFFSTTGAVEKETLDMGRVNGKIARDGAKETRIGAFHIFHRPYYGYGLHIDSIAKIMVDRIEHG